MLKAALLCSAVCTAFVVGGPSSALPQDKPAKVVKAVYLYEALKSLVGKGCYVRWHAKTASWQLDLEPANSRPLKI